MSGRASSVVDWQFAQSLCDSDSACLNSTVGVADLFSFYEVHFPAALLIDAVLIGVVTAVSYDTTGDNIAIGDAAGMIFLFSRDNNSGEYVLRHEFQSHYPEFDYLKSVEIEPKINRIKFLPKPSMNGNMLISANDKTIKLWKIGRMSALRSKSNGALKSRPKQVFSNGHAYHINSISLNSDQETFLSSDDLRINLWHLSNRNEAFLVVDMKPERLEDLTEVITSAEFHPNHCSIMAYSSSKGFVRISDLRVHSLADKAPRVLEDREPQDSKSFFSEILASISDIKFSTDGRYLLTRDYMNLRLWDLNMDRAPVLRIPIHNHLRDKLVDLYETDSIFDKFEASLSADGSYLVAGSYGHLVSVVDVSMKTISTYEATPRKEASGLFGLSWARKKNQKVQPSDSVDINKKSMKVAFHPTELSFVVSAGNACYAFKPSV